MSQGLDSPSQIDQNDTEHDKEDETEAVPIEEEVKEEKKPTTTVTVNHYKEMGLEDTSIIKKVANMVGFPLGKKGKTSSPKAGAAKGKSSGKTATTKKKTGQNASTMDV